MSSSTLTFARNDDGSYVASGAERRAYAVHNIGSGAKPWRALVNGAPIIDDESEQFKTKKAAEAACAAYEGGFLTTGEADDALDEVAADFAAAHEEGKVWTDEDIHGAGLPQTESDADATSRDDQKTRISYRKVVVSVDHILGREVTDEFTAGDKLQLLVATLEGFGVLGISQQNVAPTHSGQKDDYTKQALVVPVDVLWRTGAMRELHRILANPEVVEAGGLTEEQIALKLAEADHEIKGLRRYLREMERGVKLVPAGWFCLVTQAGDEPARYSTVPMSTPEIVAMAEERAETDEHATHPDRDSTWALPTSALV